MLQQITDERTLKRDATRILRALLTPGSILAVMPDVKSAVVVRETPDGAPRRIAVVERTVAEAMAVKDWIECTSSGKVLRYVITATGRTVLGQFLAEAESNRAGFSEAQTPFDTPPPAPRFFGDLELEPASPPRRTRKGGAQTPLQVLGRRRDKDGKPYLSAELIMVSERVRTDFELSWLGPRTAMSWEKLAGGQGRGALGQSCGPGRQMDAEKRLSDALKMLGPDLGEVVLITCCQQQGMEAAEARMAMPARSGKYVLRIALNMLLRHYEGVGGKDFDLIY